MVSIKLLLIAVILVSLLAPELVEAGSKKQRHNIKHKKSNNGSNGKVKASSYKQAPVQNKSNQRNAKMNYYNSHNTWPTANSFYRPATTSSMYQRSSSPTMFYPMHWGNSFYNTPSAPSSLMSSNMLRRSDDFATTPTYSQTPMMSMGNSPAPMMSMGNSPTSMMSSVGNSQTPMMSMGNSPIPTIIDMSAFTSSGLMDNPFTSSSQNMWSMGELPATPKPKFNFFNSFNLNDDGLFGNLFNQFR